MNAQKKLFLTLGIFILIAITINSVLAFQGLNIILPISAANSLILQPAVPCLDSSFEGSVSDLTNSEYTPWLYITEEPYCSKSGNLNYFLKQEISWGRYEKGSFYAGKSYDGCINSTHLREFYCEGNNIKWQEYKCATECNEELGSCNEVNIINETDKILPRINMINPVNLIIYETSITSMTFNVYDENLHSCWYSLNGGANISTSCSNGINAVTGLSSFEGINIWEVYAKDLYGNINSDKVTFTVNLDNKIDTTSPVIEIITPINGTVYSSHITSMSFNVYDESLHSCWYSLNGEPNVSVSCSNGLNTINSITSAEGINVWRVYAKDNSGNLGVDKRIFIVNTSGITINHPIDLIIINPKSGEELYSPLFFKTFSENATSITYSLDGNANIFMTENSNNIFISGSLKMDEGNHNVLFCAYSPFNSTCTSISFKIIEKPVNKEDKCSNCDNRVRVLPDYGIPQETRNVIILEEALKNQKLTFWEKILEFFRNLFK